MEHKKLIPQEKNEYIVRYHQNIEVWNPKEYFDRTLKEWAGFTCVITGSSKSGKSCLLKDLMIGECHLQKKFDVVVVFSKTLINGFYQSFLEGKLMFKDFRPQVIEDLKVFAEKAKEKGKRFRWLVIFDDIANARSKYQEEITDLFFSGRHYGASIIFLTQKCSLMNTGWIANTMVFISLFAGSRAEKQYLSEKAISDAIDSDFQEFSNKDVERAAYIIQSSVCQDYQSLIILPYEKEKIFKFKAKVHKSRAKPKPMLSQFFQQNDGQNS